jgi:hypothetical protein
VALAELADAVACAHRDTVLDDDFGDHHHVFGAVAQAGTTTKTVERISAFYTSPSPHSMQKRTGLSEYHNEKRLKPAMVRTGIKSCSRCID